MELCSEGGFYVDGYTATCQGYMKMRVGMGYDTHRLRHGEPFWLGGIQVPAAHGAVGHSDADVLIHALCDAILGAAGLGDIGSHFSDKDVRWKAMRSAFFLRQTVEMAFKKGWRIENADSTVCLESPRLAPHIPKMRQMLAPLMDVDEEAVSIKATTNEQLGYVGREEGVNAYAVVLLRAVD